MIISCADAFVENYVGGAELTTEAILNSSSMPIGRILSHDLTIDILRQFSHRFWVFGNIANLSEDVLETKYRKKEANMVTHDITVDYVKAFIKNGLK